LKSIVVIGGSNSHVPFVEAINRLGFESIVLDINDNCEAAKISHRYKKISTNDYEGIISFCLNEKKLAALLTYSSSPKALVNQAKAAEKLGLKSASIESTNLAIEKDLMKKCFKSSNIPTPESLTTKNIESGVDFIRKLDTEVIVKPSESNSGSEGVVSLRNIEEASNVFEFAKDLSASNRIIIEKYYAGREFTVDGIVAGKEPIILSVSEKNKFKEASGFLISNFSTGRIPSYDEELISQKNLLEEVSIESVKAMKINNSFFSVDIILSDAGPIVIECGILMDCKIDRLQSFAGFDVYEVFIRMLTEKRPKINKPTYKDGYDLTFLYPYKDGQLKLLNKKTQKKEAIVEWERKTDDIVKSPSSLADIIGWLMSKDRTSDIARKKSKKVLEKQKFFEIA